MSEISADINDISGENDRVKKLPNVKSRRLFRVWRLAPALVLILALILHLTLPNRQVETVTGAYKVALLIFSGIYTGLFVFSIKIKKLRDRLNYLAPLISTGILLAIVWDLLTLKFNLLHLPWFPGPDMVLDVFVTSWQELGIHLLYSLRLFFIGLALGGTIGFTAGVAIGWSPRWSYWLAPLQKLLGSIPAVAWLPLALVAAPSAFWASVFVVSLAVWLPVSVMTSSGVANVKKSYFEVARTLGANRNFVISRVAIPAALPTIFIGFFNAFVSSFLILVIAELAGVKAGIGWFIGWQQQFAEFQKVYAAIIVIALTFSGLITMLFVIKDRILVWQRGLIKW